MRHPLPCMTRPPWQLWLNVLVLVAYPISYSFSGLPTTARPSFAAVVILISAAIGTLGQSKIAWWIAVASAGFLLIVGITVSSRGNAAGIAPLVVGAVSALLVLQVASRAWVSRIEDNRA